MFEEVSSYLLSLSPDAAQMEVFRVIWQNFSIQAVLKCRPILCHIYMYILAHRFLRQTELMDK
jgi:hypothetical protein